MPSARVKYPRVRGKDRSVPLHHAHGCLRCGRRYTDTCTTPLDNGECLTCSVDQPPPIWDTDWTPQDCCRTSVHLITDVDVLVRYRLGGPGPWFLCERCARTHPFDPTTDKE